MRIPHTVTMTAAGVFTPVATMFLQDSLRTMMPWLMVMLAVVACDLAAGLRKSLKLGVHISWSMAFRETMGKMVVYVAFVMMVAMIDSAAKHSFRIAMWGSLLICAIEGGSIVSNMLKPHGIELSTKAIMRLFVSKAMGVGASEADLTDDRGVDEVREREKDRWEKRHLHEHGADIDKGKNETTGY